MKMSIAGRIAPLDVDEQIASFEAANAIARTRDYVSEVKIRVADRAKVIRERGRKT